jgi:DUF4097 and DUF4098 domain-containing protein YvlB
MKITLCYAVFLLSFLIAQENRKWEFESSPGKSLEVDMSTQYDITVTGWDNNMILVEADIEKREDEEQSINFRHNNGNLKISSGFMGHGGSELVIKVPNVFNLDLETLGGDIRIENIKGEIAGKTMGGDLDFYELNGPIEFMTMGGDVHVFNSQIAGELKTMGGDIAYDNVVGALKSSTMGGNITFRSSGKEKSQKSAGELELSTMGGDIDIDSAPLGVTVNTMGGDIEIHAAANFIKATTMGGDIDIDAIDGAIKASTMGGDVVANMVGNPDKGDRGVNLSSMGGDIHLTVPDGLSMDFDIKLTYTDRSNEKYSIQCDFPIKIQESESWDYSKGSAKKYIFGTGQVKDGKHKIKIETVNGDIVIRKGSK